MLRLWAPEPLPDELRARLRQHKAEIVALLSAVKPANDVAPEVPAVQSVARLPQEIAAGVHAIISADGAHGIPPQPLAAGSRRCCTADRRRLGTAGPQPRLDRGRAVRLRPAGTVAQARPRRAPAADGWARGCRTDRRCRGAQDIDGIIAALPAPTVGEAACSAVMGNFDLRSAHRATDPRADNTSERRADGGDVLGRTPPPS